MTAGMNRETGRVLVGWPHVEQSIGVILITSFGTRIMRGWFGSLVPQMLGENLTERTVLRFVQAAVVAIELFEPRFKILQVKMEGTPETLRRGQLKVAIQGDYRPRALYGDFTVEGARVYTLSGSSE